MRLKNAELVRGKIKKGSERTFRGTWYGEATIVEGEVVLNSDVIRLSTNVIGCRDQLVAAVHVALNDYLKGRANAKLRADGSDLAFEFEGLVSWKAELVPKLTMAIMGNTNRRYSPMASPLTLRWVWGHIRGLGASDCKVVIELAKANTIDEIRAAIRTDVRHDPMNDWFFKLMVKADEQGVELNPQIREAWALHLTSYYAMMGLTNLQNKNKTSFGNGSNVKYDWEKMFPPSRLM